MRRGRSWEINSVWGFCLAKIALGVFRQVEGQAQKGPGNSVKFPYFIGADFAHRPLAHKREQRGRFLEVGLRRTC